MATHPIKYTPTARVVLLARGALMCLRSDIRHEVDRPSLAIQLDAYCERIQQALKLLDPISIGELAHSMPEAPPPVSVADDCGNFDVDADYACNDTQPYRPYMTGGYGFDTAGPDQPNFLDADTGGV